LFDIHNTEIKQMFLRIYRLMMKSSLIPFALLAFVGSAQAEEIQHLRGVEGLVKVPMHFRNDGPLPMTCKSSVAHWYSLELGKANKGETVSVDLWFNPKTGVVALLNEEQFQMPVLALYCGLAGRSWETRSEIAFERRAGTVPAPVNLTCVDVDDRLVCKPQ